MDEQTRLRLVKGLSEDHTVTMGRQEDSDPGLSDSSGQPPSSPSNAHRAPRGVMGPPFTSLTLVDFTKQNYLCLATPYECSLSQLLHLLKLLTGDFHEDQFHSSHLKGNSNPL